MIIDNNEYKIAEKYNIKSNNNNKLKIKLEGIDNITNMSYMFDKCSSLSSLPDISKWNTNKVTDILIWLPCFINVHHYHHYLIFQNGILIMLLI